MPTKDNDVKKADCGAGKPGPEPRQPSGQGGQTAPAIDGQPFGPGAYWGLLLGVVAFGLLVRLFHFCLTIGSDDQVYVIISRALGEPWRDDVLPVFYSRIVWRALLAAWGTLTGGLTLTSSAVLMFAIAAGTTLLVAESARTAFGRLAGVLAAAIHAAYPLAVVYDTDTYPDGFGALLIAAAVLMVLKYLGDGRLGWLLGSAVLMGLSYSVKDYYMLAVVPLGLAVLMREAPWPTRLRHGAWFALLFLAGLAADPLLHLWESGNPLAHPQAVGDYGERLTAGSESSGFGIRQLHSLARERLRYFGWMLGQVGVASGFLLAWGAVFLAFASRKRLDCRLLLGTAAVYFLFLLAMPASFKPLALVEMQPRYLLLVLPLLAVAGGGALAGAWAGLHSPSLRWSLLAVALGGLACDALAVPNVMGDWDRAHEFAGIRDVLEDCSQRGITELVLPERYDLYVPDSYYGHGVELIFSGPTDSESVRRMARELATDSARGVFIPRTPYPPNPQYDELREVLAAAGMEVVEVAVPRSSYRAWLRWIDFLDADDELVGWLVYRASEN